MVGRRERVLRRSCLLSFKYAASLCLPNAGGMTEARVQLRSTLRNVDQAWVPVDPDSSMSSVEATDPDKAHLAEWLNGLGDEDLKKATSNEVLWWIVDMGAVLKEVQA